MKIFFSFFFPSFLQVILFEIDCAIFYSNLHELFCQFITWTNWVNSGIFIDNCWISCQVMADIKKVYEDLIIINLYRKTTFSWWPPVAGWGWPVYRPQIPIWTLSLLTQSIYCSWLKMPTTFYCYENYWEPILIIFLIF